MIESLSGWPSVHRRHHTAPLRNEREQYLTHLLQMGLDTDRVRGVAAYLIHIVRTMELTSLRSVELVEIDKAAERWANYRGQVRGSTAPTTSSATFARLARQWLRFHGYLVLPRGPIGCFDAQIAEFRSALESRKLASATIRGYVDRAQKFLRWLSERHNDLSLVSVNDLDDFIANKREAGWRLTPLASLCNALRAFFTYAEHRGWCSSVIHRGIDSPRLPKYTEPPKGPSWVEVRRLIRSVNGKTLEELRARAILLLFSIYGLRSSEVARLRLDDFDWRNETFCVQRAKRGGIQQFPIQYEVGEAILDYLRYGRPHCACRHIFLTVIRQGMMRGNANEGYTVHNVDDRLLVRDLYANWAILVIGEFQAFLESIS